MVKIEDITAYEVLDSRGEPTIKTVVALSDNARGDSIIPSGASTGSKEAFELRDKDSSRFNGKGVLKACENINTIIRNELIGEEPYNQNYIDNLLRQIDDTKNLSNLGANAVLGVSMAIARASAKSFRIPLYRYLGGANATIIPVPMLNVINGGSHSDNNIDFQEYMIMPVGFNNIKDGLRASTEIYHSLKALLVEKNMPTALGDEGGFAPNLRSNEEPIELILTAIKKAGYKAEKEIVLALDIAATELLDKNGNYLLKSENKVLNSEELTQYYKNLCNKYPIYSIEDGLAEDDWEGWKYLTNILGSKVQLVGDDLFVTNKEILQKGIDEGIANAVLVKPNQIGTISQAMETVRLANQEGYKCIMSHRSGDSEDTFISDFSVALNCHEIKAGAPARSERIAKYNRLLQIEKHIVAAQYLGQKIFN